MHAELLQCRLEWCSIERLGAHIALMVATRTIGCRAVQPRLSVDLTCEWVLFEAWAKRLVKAANTCPLDSCHMPEFWAVPIDHCNNALGVVFPRM
eukprot:6323967-Heterocapsa_arctica.AAC.1